MAVSHMALLCVHTVTLQITTCK